MKQIALLFFVLMASVLAAKDVVFYSTQTTWKATVAQSNWLHSNRERLLDAFVSEYKPGVSAATVLKSFGHPQSEWKSGGKTVWTYGLYRQKFFQVQFDEKNLLVDSQTNEYQSAKDVNFTNLLASATDPAWDIGAWRAMIGIDSPAIDRLEMGLSAARYIRLDMPTQEVEKAFGGPASVVKRTERTIWIYRLGPSDFLLVSFGGKGTVHGVQWRQYLQQNGRLVTRYLCGIIERTESSDLDFGCWQATWQRYLKMQDRRGIGKRMSLLIKLGTSREELERLLGQPDDASANIHQYDLHSDAFALFDLDAKGIVKKVWTVGD
ncbi:MAG: hypothetical protein R6X19_03625 [Kiritimatiellia bacterium]